MSSLGPKTRLHQAALCCRSLLQVTTCCSSHLVVIIGSKSCLCLTRFWSAAGMMSTRGCGCISCVLTVAWSSGPLLSASLRSFLTLWQLERLHLGRCQLRLVSHGGSGQSCHHCRASSQGLMVMVVSRSSRGCEGWIGVRGPSAWHGALVINQSQAPYAADRATLPAPSQTIAYEMI